MQKRLRDKVDMHRFAAIVGLLDNNNNKHNVVVVIVKHDSCFAMHLSTKCALYSRRRRKTPKNFTQPHIIVAAVVAALADLELICAK